jgi:thiamine transport system permease protein
VIGVANNQPRTLRIGATALVASMIALFVVWPLVRLLIEAGNMQAIRAVFSSARLRGIISFTVFQAVLSTFATLALALPAAWLVGTHTVPGRQILTGLWSAPFVLPAVVVGAAFLAVLPETQERSLLALIGAHMFFNVGMTVRVIADAWGRLDDRLAAAAATLGVPPRRRTALEIRLLAPTILSMAGVVLTLSLTSFAIVQILAGPSRSTIETEIWRQTTQRLAFDRASVLALVQLALVGTVLVVTQRRDRAQALGPRTLRPMPKTIGVLIISTLTVLTLLPILVLLRRSLLWPGDAWSFEAFRALGRVQPGSGLLSSGWSAVLLSARSAFLAMVLATCLACCGAIASARGRSWPLALLLSLPFAVSGVMLGLGTLLGFASDPIAWRSSWWMVPLMQAMIAFPFALRVLGPAVAAIDRRRRQTASTLGVSPFRAWRTVDAPLLTGPFVSAIALGAAVALGEFGATTFLVRPRSETIPVAISVLSGRPGGQLQAQAAALAVVLAVLTAALSVLGSRHAYGAER